MKESNQPPPEADVAPNLFALTLAQLGKGANLAELSSELTRTVCAVRATGKKGKITYTLEIRPVTGTEGAQVILTDKIKCETPSPDRKSALFFTTEAGQLSRRDPNQADWLEEQERLAREAVGQPPAQHGAVSIKDLQGGKAVAVGR